MQAEWERCLNYLRGMLSDTVYKTYFAQTKLSSLTTGHAVVTVPPGLDTAVYSAYKELIRLAWREVTHDESAIEFEFHTVLGRVVAERQRHFIRTDYRAGRRE